MARELAALAHVVRKSRAQKRAAQIRDRRNRNAITIQSRAITTLGREQFFPQWIEDDAQLHSSLELQTDRYAKDGIAVRVVGRAVQRVDDPAPFALAFAIFWRARARFFCQDCVLRIMSFDSIDDQTFRSQIRFSY